MNTLDKKLYFTSILLIRYLKGRFLLLTNTLMKKHVELTIFLVTLLFGALSLNTAEAANRPTLVATSLSGDWVETRVIGEPNSPVELSFYKPGNTISTTISNLGSTDTSGNLTLNVSSGLYGIPQGATASVTVQGMQSSSILWPDYSVSGLTITPTSVHLLPGQNFTVNASGPVYVASNTNTAVTTASTTNNQITIHGLSAGSAQLIICQSTTGCLTLPVTVGQSGTSTSTTTSTVTLGQNNLTLYNGQNTSISILGGGDNYVFSNPSTSNASLFNAIINGSVLNLQGRADTGTGTVTVCAANDANNCSTLTITTASPASVPLVLSGNNLVLASGQNQTITISGGAGSYYVSSNSNIGAVGTTINGGTLSLQGNGTSPANIVICAQNAPANCITLYVNPAGNIPSSGTTDPGLVLSIPLHIGQTFPFSVWGMGTENFTVTSNSDSGVATASATGNILTITGRSAGQADIKFCRSSNGTCGIISITVGTAPSSAYTFPFVPAVTVQKASNRTMLTWNKDTAVTHYDGYIIYRSEKQNMRGSEIARIDKNQTTYFDMNIESAHRYYYTPVYYRGGLISNADTQVSIQL